jgi:hypothetical protein
MNKSSKSTSRRRIIKLKPMKGQVRNQFKNGIKESLFLPNPTKEVVIMIMMKVPSKTIEIMQENCSKKHTDMRPIKLFMTLTIQL